MKYLRHLFFFFCLAFFFEGNILAQTNTWQETSILSWAKFNLYQGPSFADHAFKQESQNLVVDVSDFNGMLLDIDYRVNGGSWQNSANNASPLRTLGNVTNQIGLHYLELKVSPSNGTTWYTNHILYVTPDASKMYEDGNGNQLVMWGNTNSENRPLLLVEGFDPDNTSSPNYYRLRGNNLAQPLIDEGYGVFVLNFADGGANLFSNKDVVKTAIKQLNTLATNDIIVMGMSMGGVLARHAIVSLENDNYTHNVSHFVSLDSPQQGAVVDTDLLDWIYTNQQNNPAMNSDGSKQLLTETPFDNANMHSIYYNNLSNLNSNQGYPEDATNIGVSFANSTNAGNLNSKWLEADATGSSNDEDFYITASKDIYQPGSKLPISTSQQAGWAPVLWNPPIPLGILDLIFNWIRIPVNASYELIRYDDPTFIPYSSALDLDQLGNSNFDKIIDSQNRGYHDDIPDDVIYNLLFAIGFSPSGTITFDTQISNSFTVSDNTTLTFTGDITIAPGTTITLGKDSELIFKGAVSAIGTQANPITFKSTNPNSTSVQYDQVLFDNDWNSDTVELEWCVFEGGFYNAKFEKVSGGANGSIKNSTFRKGAVGLHIYESDVMVRDVHITDNTSNGLINLASGVNLYDSRVTNNGGKGVYVDGVSQYSSISMHIDDTIIEDNGSFGIYVPTLAFVYLKDSRVRNNGGDEIYAYSDAVLQLGTSGTSYYGENNISDTIEGFGSGKRYIYKSTLTSTGENQTSPTTKAERNYWGHYYPQGGIFYGSVDPYPYLSSDPTTGLNPNSYPMIVGTDGDGPGLIQASTVAMNQAIADKHPDEGNESVLLKSKLVELRNNFSDEEDILKKVAVLKSYRSTLKRDIEGVTNETKELDRLLLSFKEDIASSEKKTNLKADVRLLNEAEDYILAEQYLTYFELEDRLTDGNVKEVIEDINNLLFKVTNGDLQRALLFLRMHAQESSGMYEEALVSLDEIENLKPDLEIAKGTYQPMDYSFMRFDLQERAGLNPDRTPFLTPSTGDETSSIEEGNEEDLTTPERFALHNSYPNPFNPSTNISFDLPENSFVEVEVFDINGRLVSVLANKQMNAGTHTLRFDASGLASGLYIVRARLGTTQFFNKITLIK